MPLPTKILILGVIEKSAHGNSVVQWKGLIQILFNPGVLKSYKVNPSSGGSLQPWWYWFEALWRKSINISKEKRLLSKNSKGERKEEESGGRRRKEAWIQQNKQKTETEVDSGTQMEIQNLLRIYPPKDKRELIFTLLQHSFWINLNISLNMWIDKTLCLESILGLKLQLCLGISLNLNMYPL